MSRAERLAKQFLRLGIDDVRELQLILERQGFLIGLTIVPDSWLREHGFKPDVAGAKPDGEKAEMQNA